MPKQVQGIIDAENLIGHCDMDYDWELSEFEALKRDSLPGGRDHFVYAFYGAPPFAISTPSSIERRAERFLDAGLAAVRPRATR